MLVPRHNGFAPASIACDAQAIRAFGIEETRNVIRAAKNLGLRIITGFMGSPIWPYWYSFPQKTQAMVDEGFQKIVDLWTPLLDEVDQYAIVFALEAHLTEIAFDYYSFVRLLKEFGYRKTLGMNFDPSHLIWQGMKPHLMIRELRDRVYHVIQRMLRLRWTDSTESWARH